MSDIMSGSAGLAFGMGERCRCGATLPSGEATWGCTECAGDCCPACAAWLESTVYCPGCANSLLAA
jgi:hypothetical protein